MIGVFGRCSEGVCAADSFFFFLRFFFLLFFQCSVVITAEERRTPQPRRSGGRGLHGGAPTKRDCLVQFSVSTAGAFVGGGKGQAVRGSGEVGKVVGVMWGAIL